MDPQTTPTPPANPVPAPPSEPTGPAPVMPGMITPTNQPMPAPTKSKKPLVIALVIVLLLAVIGAVLFLTVLKKDDTPTKKQTTTKTDTANSTKKAASTTTALACLEQADYKWFEYDKSMPSVTFDTTYDPAKFTNNDMAEMFFKPDSTNEDSFLTIYDDWADFAKHAENKQWKFRLEGSTYGKDAAAASSKKLANDRAQKVITELVKRGVPESRIVVDPPHDYTNEEQTSEIVAIYRRVQLIIDPNCTK